MFFLGQPASGKRLILLRQLTGTMLKEFKALLLRGNVVDLAVAVVIGAAFGAVVASKR